MTKAFLKRHKDRALLTNTAKKGKDRKQGNVRIVTNRFGQPLRDPAELNKRGEGYTPFGDE